MNYELAKELKDAGFPQSGPSFGYLRHKETGVLLHAYCFDRPFEVKDPTLSELIEACGDDFGSLEHFREERFAGFGKPAAHWFAEKRPRVEKCDKCKSEIKESGRVIESGSTPEEAVANLWLALNKHEYNA